MNPIIQDANNLVMSIGLLLLMFLFFNSIGRKRPQKTPVWTDDQVMYDFSAIVRQISAAPSQTELEYLKMKADEFEQEHRGKRHVEGLYEDLLRRIELRNTVLAGMEPVRKVVSLN